MNFAPESDKELLRNIKRGNSEGLDTFLNKYVPLISRYIELLAQDTRLSEQILSDTFSSFFRLDHMSEGHTVVHLLHLAHDALLSAQSQGNASPELEIEAESAVSTQSDEVALYQTLRRLPFEYQQVLVLKDVLGLELETVVQVMRLELLDVTSLLRRSRRMLKRGFYRRVQTESFSSSAVLQTAAPRIEQVAREETSEKFPPF